MYLTKPKTPPRLPLTMDKPPITRGRLPELIVERDGIVECDGYECISLRKQAFLFNHVLHMNCHNEHIAPVCVWDALKIDQAVMKTSAEGRALHIWTRLPKGSMRCLRARSTLQFKPMDSPMPHLPLLIFHSRSRD